MSLVHSGTATSPSTLWATASKEWVIQPKPKPGRKPKKDTQKIEDGEQVDAKGRRIQNRAAQRAFRERKQSQLSELQARVSSYEQGEIERNVALQKIAKMLKEENEQLRRENLLLKEKVSQIEKKGSVKRWRDDTPSSTSSVDFPAAKKPRARSVSPEPMLPIIANLSVTHDAIESSEHAGFSGSHDLSTDDGALSLNMLDFAVGKTGNSHPHSFTQFDCGFCDEDTPCVCREVALQTTGFHAAEQSYGSLSPQIVSQTIQPSCSSSILDNLPAYQPPVPLRRKVGGGITKPIFRVDTAQAQSSSQTMEAACSGDPSNCSACADDPFGKAFCSAIEETAKCQQACSSCPCRETGVSFQDSSSTQDSKLRETISHGQGASYSSSTTRDAEIIPTNEAWRQIKAHPNVSFADLSLLADVVVSRSTCSGPVLEFSSPSAPDAPRGDDLLINTDAKQPSYNPNPPQEQGVCPRSATASPPLQLVPQEILIRCGRQRVREVHMESVRDALRMLDAKFSKENLLNYQSPL